MFRRGREDRRDGEGGGANQYQMRQNLISIGDDYWIENGRGERAFFVNGKALRVRDTLAFEDASGHELCKIQERMLRVRDSMEIESPAGGRLAMVKKRLISPIREHWEVEVENGPDMEIHGNIVDHEYTFEADGRKVAEVSKKWFRVRDTYGVEVEPGNNDVVVLAATVAMDMMSHGGK
jgi:uncharacterized protein YxjI